MAPDQLRVNLRLFTLHDAPAVVELVNAASLRAPGFRRAVVDDMGHVRLTRFVPADAVRVVAVGPAGQPLGYAYLRALDSHVLHETGGAVHPDYWGQGIGSRLLGWAIETATRSAAHAPAGARVLLQSYVYANEPAARALYLDHGFDPVRTWAHLEIDLDPPPPTPRLPDGLTIQPFDLDSATLWDLVSPVQEAAFAAHWGIVRLPLARAPEDGAADPLAAVEDDPPGLPLDRSFSNAPGFCYVARIGDAVVGGILCNARLVERTDSGRVGSLFVHPACQRRGIGRALLLTAFAAFRAAGKRRVILDTDEHSLTGGPAFYETVGMRRFRRELVYEREVRRGHELRQL